MNYILLATIAALAILALGFFSNLNYRWDKKLALARDARADMDVEKMADARIGLAFEKRGVRGLPAIAMAKEWSGSGRQWDGEEVENLWRKESLWTKFTGGDENHQT
ncbi:hypothetical protein DFH06DRAFT_1353547 [Mycena polygramma]|nr:hypothetical protein DFH06DRAFT_1353547 [Mycena polygramma]